jgi:putative phosphoribosyl transferase
MRFANRTEAGRRLARRLTDLDPREAVVLGLSHGGVPVAAAIAAALTMPLDVLVARRLVAPHDPRRTIGAIAEHGACVTDEVAVHGAGVGPDQLSELERAVGLEVERDSQAFHRRRPVVRLNDRIAVLADDGAVTGLTACAAIRAARMLGPDRVVLAVPVAPAAVLSFLGEEADQVVAIDAAPQVPAIHCWYADFAPATDEDVVAALD